jgi:hypothetical protein
MNNCDKGEEWRAVPLEPYRRVYEISNQGRLRRISRPRRGLIGGSIKSGGYLQYRLMVGYRDARVTSHALVMLAFVGPRPRGYHINHRDGNKLNNALPNLEYVTPQQNAIHAVASGLAPCGDRHFRAKLSSADVAIARARHRQGLSERALASEYGVCHTSMRNALHGKTWKSVSQEIVKGEANGK